jgi:hypothetical protein
VPDGQCVATADHKDKLSLLRERPRFGLPKVHIFDADSDSEALTKAEEMIADMGHNANEFELWNRARLVHRRERPSC